MAVELEKQINPTLVKAFMQSVQNVLGTMVGVECRIGKPTLKHEPKPSYDVSGIVGFSGAVVGSVVISFTADTAANVVESFTCERLAVESPDFADAVGELSNMIAGNAKKDFNLNASISIPNVIIGKDHTIARLTDVPCIVIPCQTDLGPFSVEINIKQVPATVK